MNRSLTVLQISTMVPPARFGGAELVVSAFSEQLQQSGFRVHNQGLRSRQENGDCSAIPVPNLYWPFDRRRRGAGARLTWHAIDALTLLGQGAVDRVVDEVVPDVIITHNLRGWGLAPWVCARRRRIPLIHVVHDYGLLCNSATLWHDGAMCDGSAACRVRAASALRRWPGGLVVGVSEAVLAEHRRRGFACDGPSAVVHPVMAAQQPTAGIRARTDSAPATVGYLGRLTVEKGLGVLLDAVARTGKQLVVAGDGEPAEVRALKRQASAEVQWAGWMEPGRFFDAIDVLVVPSVWPEPFGLVVVEAARAGVPVLLAEQPGLIEAAQASGARHRSFAVNDATSLSACLEVPIGDYQTMSGTESADIVDLVAQLVLGRPKGLVR